MSEASFQRCLDGDTTFYSKIIMNNIKSFGIQLWVFKENDVQRGKGLKVIYCWEVGKVSGQKLIPLIHLRTQKKFSTEM